MMQNPNALPGMSYPTKEQLNNIHHKTPSNVTIPMVMGRRMFINPLNSRTIVNEIDKKEEDDEVNKNNNKDTSASAGNDIAASSVSERVSSLIPSSDKDKERRRHEFMIPVRRILIQQTDMNLWMESEAYLRLLDFIQSCNHAVMDKPIPSPPTATNSAVTTTGVPVVDLLLELLTSIDTLMTETPPLVPSANDPSIGASRFGNMAFRSFTAKVAVEIPKLLEKFFLSYCNSLSSSSALSMPSSLDSTSFPAPSSSDTTAVSSIDQNEDLEERRALLLASIPEISPYLTSSFGDGTRLDYGSGHELSFTLFLVCLDMLGLVFSYGKEENEKKKKEQEKEKEKVYEGLVLRVFVRYLELVRRGQILYNLEPAGSHGVWGLDDFQFLPYFYGSSQLLSHKNLKPASILNPELCEFFGGKFMYLGCIDFINKHKKGPFHEHSPILYDITSVPSWSKLNTGMLKMYIAEVLMKFPVVQHVVFGSLLPFSKADDVLPIAGNGIGGGTEGKDGRH